MRARTLELAMFVALLAISLGGCSGTPKGIEVVREFSLKRYLGTWYEIARLDHSFERGLSKVTATYSLREDGGVRVVNRGFDAASGEWDEAVGKAYFASTPDVGQLEVSFFGPFYGGYNVIELDQQTYEYAMIAGPSRSYLWILARSPRLDREIVGRLVERATKLGFPTAELIFVTH